MGQFWVGKEENTVTVVNIYEKTPISYNVFLCQPQLIKFYLGKSIYKQHYYQIQIAIHILQNK